MDEYLEQIKSYWFSESCNPDTINASINEYITNEILPKCTKMNVNRSSLCLIEEYELTINKLVEISRDLLHVSCNDYNCHSDFCEDSEYMDKLCAGCISTIKDFTTKFMKQKTKEYDDAYFEIWGELINRDTTEFRNLPFKLKAAFSNLSYYIKNVYGGGEFRRTKIMHFAGYSSNKIMDNANNVILDLKIDALVAEFNTNMLYKELLKQKQTVSPTSNSMQGCELDGIYVSLRHASKTFTTTL